MIRPNADFLGSPVIVVEYKVGLTAVTTEKLKIKESLDRSTAAVSEMEAPFIILTVQQEVFVNNENRRKPSAFGRSVGQWREGDLLPSKEALDKSV